MCGICGFVSKRTITLEQLKQMNNTMYHRGPDDSGEEIFPLKGGWSLGVAQRRLSIMDLSALGHQPMHSADGRLTVVYNGEIYNFHELKAELSDYSFVSDCDTEVIIAGYLKWGIRCVDHFHGMFAIAIFDRENDELFLVRDRIGKKPLYYWLDEKSIVFASELKPIMECPGFTKKIREDVLARYLFQQYINAPESIFKDVYKLEPGCILRFYKGETKVFPYWNVKDAYKRQQKGQAPGYTEAKEELKQILKTAVKQRMIADVPLGTFLSGGYDSSLVTALAQEVSREPVKTFSIGFHEEKYNEAVYAKQVADYLGTNHTDVYIGEKEMFEMIDSLPHYYDEPFADSSQIPSMLVSKLAREQVTVALSGDGGDEFFCGYNVYEKVAQAQKLDGLGQALYDFSRFPGIRRMNLLEKLPFNVRVIASNRDQDYKTQLASPYYMDCAGKLVNTSGLPCRYSKEQEYEEHNWSIRRMLLDMDAYLPGDILCKVDRASMKYSLETRCPILDTRVMEYSYLLPLSYKYKDGVKKRILKDITYDYIPKELLERPKKGFSVPLDQWLRGPLKEQLLDYSSQDFLSRQNLFQKDEVTKLIGTYLEQGDKGSGSGQNYSRMVWSFFVFQQWYQYYMM